MTTPDEIRAALRSLVNAAEEGRVPASEIEAAYRALDGCPHPPEHAITSHTAGNTFYPRRGCTACDKWLEPVRLRNP